MLLVAREDEKKLQFLKSEHKTTTAPTDSVDGHNDASPYRYYMQKQVNTIGGGSNIRETPGQSRSIK